MRVERGGPTKVVINGFLCIRWLYYTCYDSVFVESFLICLSTSDHLACSYFFVASAFLSLAFLAFSLPRRSFSCCSSAVGTGVFVPVPAVLEEDFDLTELFRVSRMMVTGPSLHRDTFIMAAKRPSFLFCSSSGGGHV